MKTKNFARWIVLFSSVAGLSADAALLNVGQDINSPYYADFSDTAGLWVKYTYLGNNTGTFVATNVITSTSMAYTSSSSSPGTGSSPFNKKGFTGSYNLTANIQKDGSGNWDVTGGTITIKGNLIQSGNTSDLLLSANLRTGGNSFGYLDSHTGTTQTPFDFLFTVAGGESQIVADFFGVGGNGAVILESGTYNPVIGDFTSSFTSNFGNTGTGTADTFVPEPAVFSWAASLGAMAYAAFGARRLSSRLTPSN